MQGPDPIEPPIRVVVVDANRVVRWGLGRLIVGEKPRLKLAGMAPDRARALRVIERARPDVVLLDAELAAELGEAFLDEIAARAGAAVVMLTASADTPPAGTRPRRGGCSVVSKCEPAAVILQAIADARERAPALLAD